MSDLVRNPEDRFSHNEAQIACDIFMVILFSRFNLTIIGVVGGGVVIACAFLSAILGTTVLQVRLYEPRHEKTNNLHMRKQRRRSASR